MMNYCVLASLSFLVGVGGILTVSLLYSLTGGVTPTDLGVVVDAGSTHSQVILYNWLGNKDRGTGKVIQEDSCRVDTGLATAPTPQAAVDSLEDCLNQISNAIPSHDRANTSLFLGATAGFRLLNASNPSLSLEILSAVNASVSLLGFHPEQVRILTGQEEGLFGWISANFLTNALQSSELKPKIVGSMDLGGASTQIAFAQTESRNESIPLKLYGKDYNVVSSSSLCFGVQEAYRRHLALLLQEESSRATPIEEPCAPAGFDFNVTFQHLFNQTCTKAINNSQLLHELDYQTIYIFNGTGNSSQCSGRVSSLFHPDTCSKEFGDENCFSNVTISTTQEYFAFSSFFYTTSFLNATSAPHSEYRAKSYSLCNKTWDQVKVMPTTDNSSLPRFCFRALFIDHLLMNVYQFNESTWKNIHFEDKIHGTDAGWALGYMIYATNGIPAETPSERSIGLVPFALLLVLCTALLVLGVVFLVRYKKAPTDISYIQV